MFGSESIVDYQLDLSVISLSVRFLETAIYRRYHCFEGAKRCNLFDA